MANKGILGYTAAWNAPNTHARKVLYTVPSTVSHAIVTAQITHSAEGGISHSQLFVSPAGAMPATGPVYKFYWDPSLEPGAGWDKTTHVCQTNGGTGSGCVVKASSSNINGTIAAIELKEAGSGYTTGDVLTVVGEPGMGINGGTDVPTVFPKIVVDVDGQFLVPILERTQSNSSMQVYNNLLLTTGDRLICDQGEPIVIHGYEVDL